MPWTIRSVPHPAGDTPADGGRNLTANPADERGDADLASAAGGELETPVVRDEVCGMHIQADTAAVRVDFRGTTYYFCSARCRQHFLDHPHWYVPLADAQGL